MKSCTVAGSTRSGARRDGACMREQALRHRSVRSVPRVWLPCRRRPSRSSRPRPLPPAAARSRVVRSASSSTVMMPLISRWPRTVAVTASSSPARAATAMPCNSATDHIPGSSSTARRRATSSSKSGRQSSRLGEHQGRERVVEVVERSAQGDLRVDLRDRVGVERTDRREVDGEPPPQVHRVRATVLELLVVEERIGPGGEDLVGEHRQLGGLHAVRFDLARLDAREQRLKPSASSASCRVSATVWRTSTWSGISIGPGALSWRGGLREHGRHEVVGLHALDGAEVPAPATESQDHEGERFRFHRHRDWNMGESRIACSSVSSTVELCT